MNKRILAAFLAVMMMLSMFLLAGCDKLFDKIIDSDDESSKVLTNKEEFEEAITNLFESLKADAQLNAVADQEAQDFEADIKMNVTKLDYAGMDITSLGKIELTGKMLSDGDNTNIKLELSAFDETIPLDSTVYDGIVYFTDLFGICIRLYRLVVKTE